MNHIKKLGMVMMDIKLLKDYQALAAGTVLRNVAKVKTSRDGPHEGKEFYAGICHVSGEMRIVSVPTAVAERLK